MSDKTDNSNPVLVDEQPDVAVIHVVSDNSSAIRYIVCLIVVIALLYYVVSNWQIQHSRCPSVEGMNNYTDDKNTNNNYTDNNYQFGPLPKGTYGDVDVYFNETSDNKYAPDWRTVHGGLYIHNSRTYWKDTNRPYEADYWLAMNKLSGEKNSEFVYSDYPNSREGFAAYYQENDYH